MEEDGSNKQAALPFAFNPVLWLSRIVAEHPSTLYRASCKRGVCSQEGEA